MARRALIFLLQSVRVAALLLIAGGSVVAQAQGTQLKVDQQIIATVQAQLQALANDDAEKAFSYAAPNIRSLMLTAENFMDMVRTQYSVVYRPSEVVFLKPKIKGNDAVLRVQMIDSDGDPWIAIYTLQRQKSKVWRITGCNLTDAAGGMV